MRKYITELLVLLIAGILVASGNGDKEESEESTATGTSVEISDDEKVDEDKVVAVINGEDVTGETYNLVYSQLKLHAGMLDEEVDLEEVKEATMVSLIDRQLVMQQAKE